MKLKIIIGVIIIISIIGGIYFIVNRNSGQSNIISTDGVNENWKTYTSQVYKFQISIPADWVANEAGPGGVRFVSPERQKFFADGGTNCESNNKTGCKISHDFLFNYLSQLKNADRDSVESEVISGNTFTKYTVSAYEGKITYFETNHRTSASEIYNFTGSDQSLVRQILSTLKFTE